MHTPSPVLIATLTMLLLGAFGGTVWALREVPLPDFAALEVDAKKQRFFDYLRPHVDRANARIRQDRVRLEAIAADLEQHPPNWLERRFLIRLAAPARALAGRRFTEAYSTELQATPGLFHLLDRLREETQN